MFRNTTPHGFSLIEVMLVVALLAVMTALAGPSLLIEVQKARHDGASESVASFIARAQAEAMVRRRCVRVIFPTATTARAEVLNTFDCDVTPANASKIDGTADIWKLMSTLKSIKDPELSIVFAVAGTDGSRVPPEVAVAPASAGAELRFRPNGRIWSSDQNLTDDDAIVVVKHTALGTRKVLVNGSGLLCALKRGEDPVGAGPDFACPP